MTTLVTVIIPVEAALRIRLQFFILGLLVGWWLARRSLSQVERLEDWPSTAAPSGASSPVADVDGPPTATPAEPTPAVSPKPEERDLLTEIKGIGPTFEHALRVAGITTFAQIAAFDAESLAEKLGGRVSGERIRRENWIAQARERARAGQ